MAAADPVRSRTRVSGDKSGSCSDDVLSLDSWSENIDRRLDEFHSRDSKERNPDHHHSLSRFNHVNSAGTMGLKHQLTGRQPVAAKKDKSISLMSEPRDGKTAAKQKGRFDAIPTISANVGREATHLVAASQNSQTHSQRPVSSTSSDSDSSPIRFTSDGQGTFPLPSPVSETGAHYDHNEGHHFPFGHHHFRAHYQSSPVHRQSAGHPSNQAGHHQRTVPLHRNTGGGTFIPGHLRPHGHHHPYFSNHQLNNFHAVPFDIEREGEKIKTKMKSMWNNVKYGWTIKTKTSFKYDSPIFLLGRCYHRRAEEGDQQQPAGSDQLNPVQPPIYRVSALDEFHADFTSRLWFTYRREFSPIGSAKMTTDCGWGCMLRTGQMMVAQALVQHFLGRSWRVYSEQKPEDLTFYREIIRWFGDQLSDKVPFSLHHLVELGTSVGKMPGDWYGPASVAHIFRDAMDKAHASLPILSDVCTYVAQDCTVYLQDLLAICSSHARSESQVSSESTSAELDNLSVQHQPKSPHHQQQHHSSSEEKFRSVIILVPMRLGGETMNEIYIPCVKSMLAHDSCIGIIGGRPKHSLYFVGWQDDKLIYLDPHYCQDTVDTSEAIYPIQSFHCMSPRKMVFSKMDPSCTVGFYCRNRKDLQTFIDQVPDLVVPPRQRGSYPLFVVSKGSLTDHHACDPPVRELGRLRITRVRTDQAGNRVRSPTLESEDFVIL